MNRCYCSAKLAAEKFGRLFVFNAVFLFVAKVFIIVESFYLFKPIILCII